MDFTFTTLQIAQFSEPRLRQEASEVKRLHGDQNALYAEKMHALAGSLVKQKKYAEAEQTLRSACVAQLIEDFRGKGKPGATFELMMTRYEQILKTVGNSTEERNSKYQKILREADLLAG